METKNEAIDAQQYLRAVKVNVGTMIAVLSALLTAAAAVAKTPRLRREVASLADIHDALQRAWRAHQYARRAVDARPYDIALDRAWAALIARLLAWAELPAERSPKVARAAAVIAVLAHDGLVVLKLPYRLQWAALKARLDELHERGLDDELAALAGEEFVAEARACFEDYGRVLGLTQARASDDALPNLSELLHTAEQRTSQYVIQVLATVDPEEPGSAKAATDALRPILEAREYANAARKTAAAEGEEEPAEEPKEDAKPAEKAAEKADGKPAEKTDAKPADPVVGGARKPDVAPQRPSAPPPA